MNDEGVGVFGQGDEGGIGVEGVSTSTDSSTPDDSIQTGIGILGISNSSNGVGVYGDAQLFPLGARDNFGVKGRNNSDSAFAAAVYAQATNVCTGLLAEAKDGIAVRANSDGTALRAISETNVGVIARTKEGEMALFAENESTEISFQRFGIVGRINSLGKGSAGVHGEAVIGSGEVYGVMGETQSSHEKTAGVYGKAQAVTGNTIAGIGVYGDNKGDGVGVRGESARGIGVLAISAGPGNIIEGRAGGSPKGPAQIVFSVDPNGNVTANDFVTQGGSDFAEMLLAEEELEPGDVLAMGRRGKVVKAGASNATALIGVYSTQPGVLAGASIDGADEGKVPVGMVGIVPVKVTDENGPIHPNDSLAVSSALDGHAAKAIPLFTTDNGHAVYPGGMIVGKALQSHSSGTGTIQALLQLR